LKTEKTRSKEILMLGCSLDVLKMRATSTRYTIASKHCCDCITW